MLTRSNVALAILVLVTLVTLGLVTYETILGEPTPSTVQTLLGVVIGFLGNNLASAQGADQASKLTQPPPTTTPAGVAQPLPDQPSH